MYPYVEAVHMSFSMPILMDYKESVYPHGKTTMKSEEAVYPCVEAAHMSTGEAKQGLVL